MTSGFTIEALTSTHPRKGFASGSISLDRYLREIAAQDMKRRVSNCFLLLDDRGTVAGYYTLSATGLPLSDLPDEVAKKLPRYGLLPAALIGRLAIDQHFQGRGLGGALIIDAVGRSSRSEPAVHALLVHAKDDGAASFYRRFGFHAFVHQPRTLYLPIATALRALQVRS